MDIIKQIIVVISLISHTSILAKDIYDYHSIGAALENDLFTFRLRDRYYTNGIYLTYKNKYSLNSKGSIYKFNIKYLNPISLANLEGDVRNSFQLQLIQQMFTPDDISKEKTDYNDQPYAGMLFFQGNIFSIYENVSQAIESKVGVAGPSSGAEFMQNLIHTIIRARMPEGWVIQIQILLL